MRYNQKKLTRDFFQANVVLFFPESPQEAEHILRSFCKLGYNMNLEDPALFFKNCVENGMVFLNGARISCQPEKEQLSKGVLCHVAQFGEGYMSPTEKLLTDKFNSLSFRIGNLEKMIAEIHAQAVPKPIVKNSSQTDLDQPGL